MHRCRHLRSVAFVQLQPFVRLGMKREESKFCANRVAAHGGIHYHSGECGEGVPLISLNNITKNYGARDAEGSAVVLALKGVNLQICRGEYVAVMGSSGSGKSTLMNILGSLDLPSGGSYLFNGRGNLRGCETGRLVLCSSPSIFLPAAMRWIMLHCPWFMRGCH